MNRRTSDVLDRVGPLLHQVVERADQDRHDRKRPPAPEQVLEEDGLELDRVLGPVAQLVLEQVGAGLRGDPIDVGAVGRDQPERRREVLAGQREPIAAILVRHAQDHEGVGVGLLDQLLVGPGVDRAAAVEVDVRAEDAPEPRAAASTSVRGSPAPRSCAKNCASCARKARSLPGYDRPARAARPHPFAGGRPRGMPRTSARRAPSPGRAARPFPEACSARAACPASRSTRAWISGSVVLPSRWRTIDWKPSSGISTGSSKTPERVLQRGIGPPLMLEALGGERTKLGAFEGRHTRVPWLGLSGKGETRPTPRQARAQGPRLTYCSRRARNRQAASAQRQERGGSAIKGRDQAGGAASWGGFGCMLESPCGGASDQDSNGCSNGLRERPQMQSLYHAIRSRGNAPELPCVSGVAPSALRASPRGQQSGAPSVASGPERPRRPRVATFFALVARIIAARLAARSAERSSCSLRRSDRAASEQAARGYACLFIVQRMLRDQEDDPPVG